MLAEASAELMAAAMRSAFEDSAAHAVLLSINSPGRNPMQAGIIDDQIPHLEAKCGKILWFSSNLDGPCSMSLSWVAPVSSTA